MKVPFCKLSGSGNDFILIDHRTPFLPEATLSQWVAKICAHRLSVGADGVILIEPPSPTASAGSASSANSDGKADFRWRLFNADGSPAEMSGNGGRCAARFAYLKGIAKAAMVFDTPAGLIQAEVIGDRVKIRFTNPTDFRWRLAVEIDGARREGHFVNTGVPHLVYLVEDVDAVDVLSIGRKSRLHPRFQPAGTNVNFIQQLDAHRFKIRTYERGVEDETLACGTGSVAAALIAASVDGAESPVTLLPKGGQPLTVTFSREGERFRDIYLAGDARVVYDGEMGPEAWEY
jgi:diaminopimelate epimerase